jgi:hypothetical protein
MIIREEKLTADSAQLFGYSGPQHEASITRGNRELITGQKRSVLPRYL